MSFAERVLPKITLDYDLAPNTGAVVQKGLHKVRREWGGGGVGGVQRPLFLGGLLLVLLQPAFEPTAAWHQLRRVLHTRQSPAAPSGQVALFCDKDGNKHAFSAVCKHMGCLLHVSPAAACCVERSLATGRSLHAGWHVAGPQRLATHVWYIQGRHSMHKQANPSTSKAKPGCMRSPPSRHSSSTAWKRPGTARATAPTSTAPPERS